MLEQEDQWEQEKQEEQLRTEKQKCPDKKHRDAQNAQERQGKQ
mgnify:CR=1 FL=1